jgi:hypothetical protein
VGSDAAVDARLLPEEATVRTPRVFRVVDNPAQPASAQAADPPTVSKTRTRRRRVLHGEVTTIRPVRNELGESSDMDSATLQFGVGEAERSRYTELMNEIAGLEREAKAVKEAEARAAVRWIRKAIAEYGISASELGLRFD